MVLSCRSTRTRRYTLSQPTLSRNLTFVTTYKVEGVQQEATLPPSGGLFPVFSNISMSGLVVTDSNDAHETPPQLELRVGSDDCAQPAFGPNGMACDLGASNNSGHAFL